ncbi:MAG: hypothetical protein AAF125_01620 [Chloroflexota bacterium]
MPDETLPNRPGTFSERPKTGLEAWEATVGYIAAQHSPDVLLTLKAVPAEEEQSAWSATLDWAEHHEDVEDQPTLLAALRELWAKVDKAHVIFESDVDALRKPSGYSEFDYLDADTKDALDRLSWVTQVVFKENWTMVIIYQPSDDPQTRVQMRLVARAGDVHIGGRGPSIEDAARKLYRNATPYFNKRKD